MMRVVILASLLSFAALAEAQDYSADAYATCAACHLPDGAGVPGAFPRIRDRAATIASLDGGREYLVTVVTYGLMGAIEVDGNTFYGIMAGNVGMSSEELAAALNYVVFERNDNDASDTEPFTAGEVEAAQAATTLKSPAGGGELRVDLVDKHGDEWP